MRKKADEEAAARKRAEEERERVKKEAEGAAQKVYTYMHPCVHAMYLTFACMLKPYERVGMQYIPVCACYLI